MVAFFALLGFVVVVAALVTVNAKVLKPRRSVRWEAAKARATWQDNTVTQNGKTMVVVQRIAVDGNRREVLDQVLVGTVLDGADRWQEQLDLLQMEALRRTYQLNTGPLS